MGDYNTIYIATLHRWLIEEIERNGMFRRLGRDEGVVIGAVLASIFWGMIWALTRMSG